MSNKGIKHHGWSKTRFYAHWTHMVSRCGRQRGYKDLEVSASWKLFTNFLFDMFDSYQKHAEAHGWKNTTLDRIDNLEGYSKENCRWATYSVQNSNQKNTKFYTHNGISDTLTGWATRLGMNCVSLLYRLRNFPPEDIFRPKEPWVRRSKKKKAVLEQIKKEGKV